MYRNTDKQSSKWIAWLSISRLEAILQSLTQLKLISKLVDAPVLDKFSPGHLKSWQVYVFATVVTAATLALRISINDSLQGQAELVMFTIPIMLSAYVGGLRGGLLATALSYFGASYYLLQPIYSFQTAFGVEHLLEFFLVLAGLIISIVNEALHRARHRADILAAIVTSSDDAIISKDLNGIITSWNRGAEKIFGYMAHEIVGASVMQLIPAGREEDEVYILGKIRQGESVERFETLRQTKDGRLIDISLTASPINNATGKVVDVSIVMRDITAHKLAGAAVQLSEEYFRFLNDLVEATRTLAIPAQIMAVTARMLGEHLHASRCAYADVEKDGERFTILHDYTDNCASTVGNYQLSLFGPRAVTTLYNGQTLIVRNVEAELLSGEGADMFNAIGIKAIITCPLVKDGILRAMMAVHQTTPRDWKPAEIALVQDVVERCWATIERRTAEEKIHELNAELEQRVARRTAELETANNELEAFSYSVSHDLRAPLRAIDGFSQALLDDYSGKLDDQGKNYLGRVRAATQRMGQLIDDMLALARVTRDEMQHEAVNLSILAADVVAELQKNEPGRKVDWHIEPKLIAEGDAPLLRVVLDNLLGNAWKYTARQSQPRIEFGAIHNANGTTDFFVRDNGVGYDMAYADKLFGAFQRLHTLAEFPGTGVGLATVQRIIHRHGGQVRGEGAPDQGATFYFSLPNQSEHGGIS